MSSLEWIRSSYRQPRSNPAPTLGPNFAWGRLVLSAVALLGLPVAARASLPVWLQHVIGASTIESALYRVMQLPSVEALYPRPPKESQNELDHLITAAPGSADLYQLRARVDEQALDEAAAEADWKLYAAHAQDSIAAKLELADFYQRRLLIPQAIATLTEVAEAPPLPAEAYIDPMQQRSWRTFERILWLISQQGLPPSETTATFNAALHRYPDQPAFYAAFLQFQLDQKDWVAAEALIDRYHREFPQDMLFPVRAQALLDFRRGNIDAALAVYDHAFQPLWPAELIQSYFALLERTHRQRAFLAEARTQLAAHPDGAEALNALARIFYYEQQAGHPETAQQTLDAFRVAREARNGSWTPADLSTLATLAAGTHAYAESARYNYALAATEGTLPNGEPAAQAGLAGLIHILLEAPEQPLALSSQNLTLYRDIATLDQGPGYWNGILSLWLNGSQPQTEYATETAKAQSYFHRSKASELLAELDKRYPAAAERPTLHAALIHALAQYGEPAAVLASGREFLSTFPTAPERLDVAELMADAYAHQNDTAAEFALYDAQLSELASKTGGLPLSAAATAPAPSPDPNTMTFEVTVPAPDANDTDAKPAQTLRSQPLVPSPSRRSIPEATAYARILDRYLGRLTTTGNLPRALTVLRTQLDRNPNDPLLYERLATFLQQNNLSAQQEQVFEQAIAKFQQPTYYDKLARFYLREQRREAFAALTRKVTDTFSGTDLDGFFANVHPSQAIGPQLVLQLNLYAAQRFPHDLVFTRNLLNAYQAKVTFNNTAYEALLRRHWWEADDLRDEFLIYLSRTNRLQDELAKLQSDRSPTSSQAGSPYANPAAQREQAEIHIFASHFEQAAPLLSSVADLYPADADTGDQAVSLFRSLAYLDPTPASTGRAVALEKNLLLAAPDSPDRLATLGDLYAEATSTGGEDLAAAAPYWHRIPELHPGSTQGFLTASTIFWDYFQFADALAEVTAARSRFHAPALFGYEAGAIDENRHDLPAAVAEYTHAVLHPIDTGQHFDSAAGVIQAWLNPPSDAADSNFRATAQSFVGSSEANARLLRLAIRPTTRSIVDRVTAQAIVDDPANTAALTLRADVLTAQHDSPELTPLLTGLFNQALDRTATVDEAAAVGALAQARNVTAVYERALRKQAGLTLDPVQKIELQYALARSLEAHKDIPAASGVIDTVYQANPRILGVVRTTTDFYVRTNQPARAISTLLEAAKAATPMLARDFTLEAASRANDIGDAAQARALALRLLTQTPYDPRVLHIIATSYAQAHDDAGLKQFYLARLDQAKAAPDLSLNSRRQDIALIRRGLIPALTRLNDFEGATNQYIALLSAFPEDSVTAQEAALYALQHSRQPQLLGFLRTTVKQSPQDSRFAILLAQTETCFEDLPAAEAAYSQAVAVRKDRADLYSARADIEVRLSQSDPSQTELAAADFEHLYSLSYHDPLWMVRLAELRVRQQRPAEAVKALETAYITGHTKSAAEFFTVADRLAAWDLLQEARTFAEQGVSLAGDDLLTPPGGSAFSGQVPGAVIYARIVTRLGRADEALAVLIKSRRAAEVSATSPGVLAAEIARENIDADEAKQFRQNFATQHRQLADSTLKAAVKAVGETAKNFYTPEQKLAFAQSLDKLHDANASGGAGDLTANLALEAASAAGLADREATWRGQVLLTGTLREAASERPAYTALQRRRLRFAELAETLEAYAARLQPEGRGPVLHDAAVAYREAGDLSNEMRLDRSLALGDDSNLRDRFFDLLLHHDRAALIALAANKNTSVADDALNYTIAHASQAEALVAVTRRGQSLPPVWRPASASLVDTYFATPASMVAHADDFTQSLTSERTIADRLASPTDVSRQLTGDNFFFYGSRFGIFLATVRRSPSPATSTSPDAEDFLPAALERAPTSTAPYLDLARTYAETNNIPAAVAEFNHALEISPSDPAIDDELATMLYRADHRQEAVTRWKAALDLLRQMQQHAQYPESWFTNFETIMRHLGEHHLTAAFNPDIDAILRPYLAHNGNYRSNELLKAVYTASATPEEGTRLILTLANAAFNPNQVLEDLHNAPWLTEESRVSILLRQIELARNRQSDASDGGPQSAISYAFQLIDIYLSENDVAKAQPLFDSLPDKVKTGSSNVDHIILAVRGNHLATLLDSWRDNPDSIPNDSAFEAAMYGLQRATPAYKPDPAVIRPLVEFVFANKDRNHSLIPTDFLRLAQLRLDTYDVSGALQILRRLTLQAAGPENGAIRYLSPSDGLGGREPFNRTDEASLTYDETSTAASPYRNTDYAATLLEDTHHFAEAIPFLESLIQSVPWNASYRLRLGVAQLAAKNAEGALQRLAGVAKDTTAPYDLRLQAAKALGSLPWSNTQDLGSNELGLVAHPTNAADARQPYFTQARIATAATPASSADFETLLREAIAIAPDGADANRARLSLLLGHTPVADQIANQTANPSTILAIVHSIEEAPIPIRYGNGSDIQNANADTSSDDLSIASIGLPAFGLTLDLPTQIRLANQLSYASQRDDDLQTALRYAQLALTLAQGASPSDPAPNHHRDALRAALLLDERNAPRRPNLHAALAQTTQVRPRLSAADLAREVNR